MLIGNGRLIDKVPLTLLGRDWNGQLQAGRLPACTSSDNFGSKAALPNGYYTPHGWMLPRKGGNLIANTITGSGTASATAQSGYNIDATITGSGGVDNSTSIGLIVSIAAVLTASGGISSATTQALATMVADLTGSGDVTATAQGLAELGAALTGSGSVTANNTALMDITATIRGYGDLTPEGIRDTVWQAVLANYPTAGTAGNALSTASSGGVDLNALAAAVWTYVNRTLTSSGGTAPTAEEVAAAILAAAQITPIHSDIRKVNDVTVTGTGVPPTFDSNGVMTDPGDPWAPV